MVGDMWPWTLTLRSNYCFFTDKFVSGLQLVCLTRYAVDIRHVCRSPQDDVSHAMVGDLWPWIWPQIIVFLMTSSCPGCNFFVLWDRLLILDMWVDHLKMMCGVPCLVTFDFELWPQGQIIAFLITGLCPGCNCFVLWDRLLILCMWVDHIKRMCHVPWLVTFDFVRGLQRWIPSPWYLVSSDLLLGRDSGRKKGGFTGLNHIIPNTACRIYEKL